MKIKSREGEATQITLQDNVSKAEGGVIKNSAEIERLKEKLTSMEAYSRRDNLVFFNVPEETGENCSKKITDIIKERLGVTDIKFTRVHRLGAYKQGQTRAVIARFHYFPKHEEV